MNTEASESRVTVSVVATPEVAASILFSIHEIFMYVGRAWGEITGQHVEAPTMPVRIVAESLDPIRTGLGVLIEPDSTFETTDASTIVIVPDLDVRAIDDVGTAWPAAREWLLREHSNGAVICSVCTGSLMLAAAGLLDDQEATTHWSATELFESKFPQVRLRPEYILAPAGPGHRIVTSGGASAWGELSLYLIARFSGEDEARRMAKLFLLGDLGDGQLPFAMLARPRQHEDQLIAECQSWVARHYDNCNPVESMTAVSGLPVRTFARRFKRATGYSPLAYVQTLRVEEAKQMLEATSSNIDDIAALVGYQEAAAFRRLFKRLTGVGPKRYREKFKNAGWQVAAGS